MEVIIALFHADGILPIDKKDENNSARGSANADTNSRANVLTCTNGVSPNHLPMIVASDRP